MLIPYRTKFRSCLTPCPHGVTYQSLAMMDRAYEKDISFVPERNRQSVLKVGSYFCQLCPYHVPNPHAKVGRLKAVECSHPGNKES